MIGCKGVERATERGIVRRDATQLVHYRGMRRRASVCAGKRREYLHTIVQTIRRDVCDMPKGEEDDRPVRGAEKGSERRDQ